MKMTFRVIVIGGVIVFFAVVIVAVFVPGLIWKPAETTIAHPYTEAEEAGRELFYSNGCNYCHTQYVREVDNGMGPVSEGGNYVFDNPVILGSERTGPDISYIGRKRSEQWEINHLKSPRDYSPLSIMPSFEFLSDTELTNIAAYLFALGDRTAAEWMILPPVEYTTTEDPIDYGETTPTDQDQGWVTWNAADLQTGKELYVDRCLTCHGCSGNGLGSYAGTLTVTPADFKQEPIKNMTDDQWFWHVSEGVQGTVMPPWKESMTEAERWEVIRYIQQIFSRPVMRDPAEGDPPDSYASMENPVTQTVETLEEGKTIFIRECMVCHGDAGTGSGPYANDIQPSPPDFSDGSYGTLADPSYTDADYFWRISEGLPWSAMPSWKLRYSEDDRWKVVYYIRVNFTQTLERPSITADQVYPDIYLTQTMPSDATTEEIVDGSMSVVYPLTPSFANGQLIYLQNCVHCHGLSGQGDGWDGQYLDVAPANFTDPNMAGMTEGDYFARISFGIQNSAMPTWGEYLPQSQRWDVIQYIQTSFQIGTEDTGSLFSGEISNNFLTLSSDNWTSEGHVISPENGLTLYSQYCAGCHGDSGQADGSGLANLPSGGPEAFPNDLPEAYIFERIWQGVPDSIMPPFSWLLSETDIWDITTYVQQMLSSQGGQ